MVSNTHDIDWAEIIDILAKEYGWTIEYIKSLDLGQISALLKVIKSRYSKQNEDFSDTPVKPSTEISIADFKTMGGKEIVREDGRTEIVL